MGVFKTAFGQSLFVFYTRIHIYICIDSYLFYTCLLPKLVTIKTFDYKSTTLS